MSAPSATCEVLIDGVRVPDTGADLLDGTVTALSGLTLTWGRDGQNEQPSPASVTLDLLDPTASGNILDLLHVGSSVEVWAEGDIPGGAEEWGAGTFDPAQSTFTGWPDGPPPANTVRIYNSTGVTVEAEQLKITPGDLNTTRPTFAIPPRPFVPAGTLPDAWDDIPQMRVGETWKVTFSVKAPIGISYDVMLQLFSDPYENAGIAGGGWWLDPATPWAGTGEWQNVTVKVALNSGTGGWAALRFSVANNGIVLRQWQGQTTIWADDIRTWGSAALDTTIWVDNAEVYPPGGGTVRRVLTFSGEISDLSLSPAGDGVSTAIRATAMDFGAELGNKMIGDEPWPVQTLATRADRIAALAGITSTPRIRIDDPLGPLQVSYRDIDAQAALGLLQDLAQTGGGVLWAATHAVTGPYLWIENPATRVAIRTLSLDGGQIIITDATRGLSPVSACDLLESSASWRQDSADVITVAAVGWQEQGVDDDGQPAITERTVTVTDTDALAIYGTRRLSVSTDLIAEVDATAMAHRLLAQARAVAWRLDGLVMDTAIIPAASSSLSAKDRQVSFLTLLDGTSRMGLGLTLVDMPAYAPNGSTSAVYVEGGKYDYSDGFWSLALTTTPAFAQGSSATWADFAAQPEWQWSQWSPEIQWGDLFGVSVE